MQKFSLFHLLISEVQSILDKSIFDHIHPKKINQLLIFVNLYQHTKNQLFYPFIFQIQSILESHDQNGYSHFWPSPPPEFSITFKFVLICTSMQKIS